MNLLASPAMPLLYSFRRCPYAIRARLALMKAQRAFSIVEISLRDKPAEMLAISPRGTVPVLQLVDGQVLQESWQIMEWALLHGDGDVEGWWGRAQEAQNLALLHCNDGEFKHWLDRYKYPQRYPEGSANAIAARSSAVAALLVPLESRLARQRYLGGASPCATDLAIFPFVRQFAAVEPAWLSSQGLPALHAWLAAWLGSRLFETCMAKPLLPSASAASGSG